MIKRGFDFKLFGSVLLIIGTSVGAGMLALPVATSQLGFIGSSILLVLVWLYMTIGALLILEANLWLPTNSNLISMARATIGTSGALISWLVYLLLLYSLLCAYIAGGGGLLANILKWNDVDVPHWLTAFTFTLIFGGVVYMGIHVVDQVNRVFMFVKFGAYILLVLLLMPFISVEHLDVLNLAMMSSAGAITVAITSFGYSAIVPSLRIYLHGDVAKLKKAIFIGSIIPLICYLFWNMSIMGIIPITGSDSLANVMAAHDSVSSLVNTLISMTSNKGVALFAKLFTSICIVTSFFGVSLCLADFLADGMRLEKRGMDKLLVHAFTFLPPFLIVVFMPGMFLKALKYAGIYCVVLLVLIPAWMVWSGRYKKQLTGPYKVIGGKPLLLGVILVSFGLAVYALWELLLST